jgi:hypothetical protein
MEGSGRGLVQELFQNFPVGTEDDEALSGYSVSWSRFEAAISRIQSRINLSS